MVQIQIPEILVVKEDYHSTTKGIHSNQMHSVITIATIITMITILTTLTTRTLATIPLINLIPLAVQAVTKDNVEEDNKIHWVHVV